MKQTVKLIRTAALALYIAAIPNVTKAQSYDVAWKQNFGGSGYDEFTCVIAVPDGYVAVGSSDVSTSDSPGIGGNSNNDAIIVKFNTDGTVAWEKHFGGNDIDNFNSVVAVSDGYVAVGYSWKGSFGNGDWTGIAGKGYDDAIIVKFNTDGTIAWKKNFGGSGDDRFNSVTAVSDGYVAVGYSWEGSFGNGDWTGITGKGECDAIIVKFNTDGTVAWKQNFGGIYGDFFNSVTAVSDGYIAVGDADTESFGNGDWAGITGKGGIDAIIVKFNTDGTVAWKQNFGGSARDMFLYVTAVADGYVAVGYAYPDSFGNGDWTGITGKGFRDAIIVKFNTDGTVAWRQNFGGNSNDYFYSVTEASDGYVAVGYAYYASFGNGDLTDIAGKGGMDAIIVKFNTDGTVEWKQNFGGSGDNAFFSIISAADEYVVIGAARDLGDGDWAGFTGKGGTDAIIVKYQPVLDGTVSINGNSDLYLYPNPASDMLNFSVKMAYEITDLQGRTLLKNGKAAKSVNISSLPAGIYFIKTDNDTAKFIKK